MADFSFDIVSKLDKQEVDNALNQARKELAQRYDFKNTEAKISYADNKITLEANSEERVQAVLDVLQSKLIRRGVSVKFLDLGDKKPSTAGKLYRLAIDLKEGIDKENAKAVTRFIRDNGPKGARAQIEGEQIKVSSKSKDQLQEVISLLKQQEFDCDLQFVNYR